MNKLKILLLICIFFISSLLSASADEALFKAAEKGDLVALNKAIKSGANVNQTKTMGSTSGLTPLMAASRFGHIAVAKILISKGANVNAQASDGFTALMLAACLGNEEFVKLLIQAGANINASTPDGYTATRIAQEKGFMKIVAILKKGKN
jgi:ankyrin repeat protein